MMVPGQLSEAPSEHRSAVSEIQVYAYDCLGSLNIQVNHSETGAFGRSWTQLGSTVWRPSQGLDLRAPDVLQAIARFLEGRAVSMEGDERWQGIF
jgi:hypothetical protein